MPSRNNAVNFEKWFEDKLLPALPANSLIVMDDASYSVIIGMYCIHCNPLLLQARRKQIKSGETMSGQFASTRSLFKAIQLPKEFMFVEPSEINTFNTIHKFYQILEHLQKFAPSYSIIIHIILFNKTAL